MIETIRKVASSRYLPLWLRRALLRSHHAVFPSPLAREKSIDASLIQLEVESSREVETVIARIYQLALQRIPSAEDSEMWLGEVLSRRMSLASVVESIAASPEAALVRQRTMDAYSSSIEGASIREVDAVVHRIYHLALERTPSPEDRQLWLNEVMGKRMTVAGVVEAIASSPEAMLVRQRTNLALDVPNGRFVQFAYEYLLERSPMVSEVVDWDHGLSRQGLGRSQLVLTLFERHAKRALSDNAPEPAHDPGLAPWMGTDRFISVTEWQQKAAKVGLNFPPVEPQRYQSLRISHGPEILVSAIASLYCGGEFIEQFLENITSQTIFEKHCELIIIDADSPENEAVAIARYMKRFPNIVYHRADARIGIYEAWNLGVRMARGRHITNTNMDDLRRSDSFERQVEILGKFPFVDVVYQDFWYSFEGHAPFAKSAAAGVKSDVPVITPYNLMQSNSPHNAPMWRHELHDVVGMFDETYRSAGDYDFWLRCLQAGKVFYKLNDPHVIYFVNPEGLSTKPNTRGIDEANRSTKLHGRNLLSPWLLSSDEAFIEEASRLAGVQVSVNDTEQATREWRYTAAQHALRALRVRSAASNSISHD